MVTDPVADMLSRLRNAIQARHLTTQMPASRLKRRVAEILKSEGYVSDVRDAENDKGQKNIEIVLKYTDNSRRSAIDGLKRISKPGRRVYVGHGEIPHVLSGLGISILSTSSGVMTGGEARKRKVGGEVLCEVW